MDKAAEKGRSWSTTTGASPTLLRLVWCASNSPQASISKRRATLWSTTIPRSATSSPGTLYFANLRPGHHTNVHQGPRYVRSEVKAHDVKSVTPLTASQLSGAIVRFSLNPHAHPRAKNTASAATPSLSTNEPRHMQPFQPLSVGEVVKRPYNLRAHPPPQVQATLPSTSQTQPRPDVLKKSKSNTRKSRKHNSPKQRAPKRAKTSLSQASAHHLSDTDSEAVVAGVQLHMNSDGSVDNPLHPPQAESHHTATPQPACTFNFYFGGAGTPGG